MIIFNFKDVQLSIHFKSLKVEIKYPKKNNPNDWSLEWFIGDQPLP